MKITYSALSLIILLWVSPTAYAIREINPISYQSFAYLLVKDSTQMKCLVKLYHHESKWNPRATNNGHYGIPQGKSKWLKTADPYEQIEWGIAYNLARYGNMCNAYNHWRRFGWH